MDSIHYNGGSLYLYTWIKPDRYGYPSIHQNIISLYDGEIRIINNLKRPQLIDANNKWQYYILLF